jgi:hypothetical protein
VAARRSYEPLAIAVGLSKKIGKHEREGCREGFRLTIVVCLKKSRVPAYRGITKRLIRGMQPVINTSTIVYSNSLLSELKAEG